MNPVHDDGFMVFLRYDGSGWPVFTEAHEEPLAACTSYGEARRIRRAMHEAAPGECVIRFVGETGGGD
jgi:hypothetical protein